MAKQRTQRGAATKAAPDPAASDRYTVADLLEDLEGIEFHRQRAKALGWDGVLRAVDADSREGYKQRRIVEQFAEKHKLEAKIAEQTGVARLRLLYEAEGSGARFLPWLRQRKAQLAIATESEDDGASSLSLNDFAREVRHMTSSQFNQAAESRLPTLAEFIDQLDAAFEDPAKRQWICNHSLAWLDAIVTKDENGNFTSPSIPLPPTKKDDWSLSGQLTALAVLHDELFNGPSFLPELPDHREIEDHEKAKIALLHGMHWVMLRQVIQRNDPGKWIVELCAMLRNVEAAWATRNQGIPELSQRQYNVIQAMNELSAFTPADRCSAAEIAARAEGPESNVNNFKRLFVQLKDADLIGSHGGRQGGYWLTESGKILAEQLIK